MSMKRYARLAGSPPAVAEVVEAYERPAPPELPPPNPLPAWPRDAEKGPERLEAESLYAAMVRTYEERRMAIASHVPGQQVPVEELYTPDFVAQLVEIPEGEDVQQGYLWAGGAFAAPPPPTLSPKMVAANRDGLLAQAALRIAPLQDAADLGDATAEELALLARWKQYRVALGRVDLDDPQWPEAPQ